VRKTALFAGVVMAATAAVLVLLLRAAGKADAPGFFGLGTRQADINITLELLLVAGLTFGMMLARRGSIDAHRVNQTMWVLVNAALVALIMIASTAAAASGVNRPITTKAPATSSVTPVTHDRVTGCW
jgi:hypothetical protein